MIKNVIFDTDTNGKVFQTYSEPKGGLNRRRNVQLNMEKIECGSEQEDGSKRRREK